MEKALQYDAVIVGSGPNGLAAGIVLQEKGLSVLIIEGKNTVGGGMRSFKSENGFTHDICSAIQPLAADSPYLKTLPLEKFGLEWIYPTYSLAHPLDNGNAAILQKSLQETSAGLGNDGASYRDLMEPFVSNWEKLAIDILGPLRIPKHPLIMARFGLSALRSAKGLIESKFKEQKARALFAGLATHSMLPLDYLSTSAIGLVLGTISHTKGWPLPKGGSQSIAKAMAMYFESLGGKIETGKMVQSLHDIPNSKALLFDLTPKQILKIAGDKFSKLYTYQLNNFKYGPGVFKIDFELKEKIPFKNSDCSLAGTVHLGGTYEEIALAEKLVHENKIPDKPYVLLAQQSLFDNTRAPGGKHTAWAYCHVPNGSTVDMSSRIENQIERFAPGFKDLIIAKYTKNSEAMEAYNPNYIGGDINGGAQNLLQIYTRPVISLSPYNTSSKGIYLCSSSTPPGGGVHGMCGYFAAKKVLHDLF